MLTSKKNEISRHLISVTNHQGMWFCCIPILYYYYYYFARSSEISQHFSLENNLKKHDSQSYCPPLPAHILSLWRIFEGCVFAFIFVLFHVSHNMMLKTLNFSHTRFKLTLQKARRVTSTGLRQHFCHAPSPPKKCIFTFT